MNNSTRIIATTNQTLIPVRKSQFYKGLENYALGYWRLHPYLSLTICTFGIITNIVNIVILTRKKMRNPINCVLTGIAISDIFTMIDYIPFAVHFYISTDLGDSLERYTYGWSTFMAVHSCLSNTTHTISIWLAVCMSAMRYVFIRTKGNSGWNLDIRSTCAVIIVVYCLSIIVFIPNYMLTEVEGVTVPVVSENRTATLYKIKSMTIHIADSSTINTVNVWIFILIGKVLPCFLICAFGGLLLRTLSESRKLSESLKQATCSQRMRAHKRTTVMLLVIILMFIIAELPSGILVLVSVFVDRFFSDYYLLFADTLDILSLINNAVNFIMYCSMSRQFRECLLDTLPACMRAQRRHYKSANATKTTMATQL